MTVPLSGRVCGFIGCHKLLTTREGKYCAACEARLCEWRKARQARKRRKYALTWEQIKEKYGR